ncbi:DUF4190 domain-containing protein [Streptomyces sp. NPDC052051]|uniref:DUF4190 domain-containing protein n=1 Tax=Streptomyces sp. NPDC052051 TaxID=3154649 RepID=UPI0034495662
MSDTNPGPGGFGPPSQPPPPGYAPQSEPMYGYPQQAAPQTPYPAAPPAGYPQAPAGYQQAPVGYPQAPLGYPQAPAYVMAMQPSNGLGTTGLVLGIIGLVCTLTGFLVIIGIILGILAIIFGAIGRGKANRGEATNKGAATAGLVCGITATVILPVLGFLFFASLLGGLSMF